MYCNGIKKVYQYECRFSFDGITTFQTTMSISNKLSINLTPLRLHSSSSVRIPNSVSNFQNLLPSVITKHLNLQSASSVNV